MPIAVQRPAFAIQGFTLIYGNQKFYTLPHHHGEDVLTCQCEAVPKSKSRFHFYHGGLQSVGIIDILIDAYVN
jgi:hypothetical protein